MGSDRGSADLSAPSSGLATETGGVSRPQAGVSTGDAPLGHPPLALIFAITATALMSHALISAVTPDIVDDFGLSDGQVGNLVASASVAGIVIAPLVGFLADRHGRRRVILPCLIIYGVFSTVGAFAPTFTVLLVARFLQGLGSAGLVNMSVVLIADNWTGNQRARLIGFNSAVLTGSLAVYPSLGGLLADQWGWRASFAPYLLTLVVAGLAFRYLADTAPRIDDPYGDQFRAAVTDMRRPVMASTMVLGFVTFVLIFGVFLTVMAIHLDRQFGLGPSTRGLVYVAPAVASTLIALSLGRLRQIAGPAVLVPVGIFFFAAAFGLIGLTDSLAVAILAAVMYGLGEGLSLPTLQDVVAGQAAPRLRGALVALWTGFARAGQVAGPLVAGIGIDRVGTSATFLVAAVGAAAVVVVLVLSRPYRTLGVDGIDAAP